MAAIARDCAVNRKVVENYFSILRDTLLSYEIPAFTRRAQRDVMRRVKFYFFDARVFRAIRPAGPYDSDSETGGAALETLVLQEIAAQNDYGNYDYKICYRRTRQGTEVDFILYGKWGFKAIEVKRSARARREDFKGLRQFKKDHPQAELLFVYSGTRRYHEEGIEIVPAETFRREWRKLFEANHYPSVSNAPYRLPVTINRQASIRRSPLGSGIGSPNSRAVSIQSSIAWLTWLSAASCVSP